jgi:hypothetical protein
VCLLSAMPLAGTDILIFQTTSLLRSFCVGICNVQRASLTGTFSSISLVCLKLITHLSNLAPSLSLLESSVLPSQPDWSRGKYTSPTDFDLYSAIRSLQSSRFGNPRRRTSRSTAIYMSASADDLRFSTSDRRTPSSGS